MRNSTFLTSSMLALGLLLSAGVAQADALDLSEGTLTTAGNADLKLNPIPINNIQSSSLGWEVQLKFGYFVLDNLEVDLGIASEGMFTSPISKVTLGFGAGATYFFDLGSMIYPYLGLMPTISWEKASALWAIGVPLSAGILMSLNSHVALDFGLTAGLSWSLKSGASKTPNLYGRLGYFGVRAFF